MGQDEKIVGGKIILDTDKIELVEYTKNKDIYRITVKRANIIFFENMPKDSCPF